MKLVENFAKLLIVLGTLFGIVSSSPNWYKDETGKSYLIDTETKYNWHEAMHECARRDAQLVSIETKDKWDNLYRLILKVNPAGIKLWTGGHDELNSDKSKSRPFYWSATGQRLTYTNWNGGEPNNAKGNEHCLNILPAVWNDIFCTDKYGFVCEENHYLASYKNNLNIKKTAVQQKNTIISQLFDVLQKQQLSNINEKLKDINDIEDKWKVYIQKQLDIAENPILQTLYQQQLDQLQLISKHQEELKNSVETLNKEFAKELHTRQGEILNVLVY